MRLEEHFESSSTLQRNERVKLAASFWNNVGAGMVIGGMAAAFFLDKPSGVWTKIGIAIGCARLALLFNCQQPVDLFAHSTRSAALGQRAILPTECIAGLAVAKPEHIRAGGRAMEVVRMKITEAGRQALTGKGTQ